MSRLDSLLSMVDNISARSDKLVSTMKESNILISQIMESNAAISRYDLEIDNMTQLMSQNNAFLAEFQKLYEKSFFLDSNFELNDSCVNDTSFGNLYSEYDYLWHKFNKVNTKPGSIHSRQCADTVMTLGHSLEDQVSPKPDKMMKNVISISNLNLKPLRCRDIKVSKQKSRYRLSEVYTLNPLQALPARDTSECSTDTKYSNIMGNSDQENLDYGSSFSVSTNSPICDKYDSTLLRTPKFSAIQSDETAESIDNNNSPLLLKSLQSSSHGSYDAEKTELEFKSYSLDSKFEDFDNFDHFLRQSRLNFEESFPAHRRSRSHDSSLSLIRMSYPSSIASYGTAPSQFHNPAYLLMHKKPLSTKSTVEATYSTSAEAASKFKEHSSKLLATQPPKLAHSRDTLSTPTKSQKFDLFGLMRSPLGSPKGVNKSQSYNTNKSQQPPSSTSNHKTPERRTSIDIIGKSLASTFMSLVSPSSLPHNAGLGSGVGLRSKSPPEKIKKMKKNLKKPISSQNDIKSKRLPPLDRHLKIKSSSSSIIDPYKTKIVKQETNSVFYKPTLRRLSQAVLADALNDSILFP